MNANQILNMVVRIVMRRMIGRGVNLGMNAVERKMNKGKPQSNHDMGPENREMMKRAKRSMRATRRMGKF